MPEEGAAGLGHGWNVTLPSYRHTTGVHVLAGMNGKPIGGSQFNHVPFFSGEPYYAETPVCRNPNRLEMLISGEASIAALRAVPSLGWCGRRPLRRVIRSHHAKLPSAALLSSHQADRVREPCRILTQLNRIESVGRQREQT